MSKILVAYFSATGTTADAAKRLADAVKGDLFDPARRPLHGGRSGLDGQAQPQHAGNEGSRLPPGGQQPCGQHGSV